MESTPDTGTRVGGRQRVSRLLSAFASPLDKALFNSLANHLSREEQSHTIYPTWASHYIAFVNFSAFVERVMPKVSPLNRTSPRIA